MANFDLIKTVEDIRSELQASTAYSNECITKQCDIGKEVWIKYYYGGTLEERTFEINGEVGIGGTASIMLYVENDDKSYNVYKYNGMLNVQRTIADSIKHDVLVNIETIISDLINHLSSQ
jgi:hypothetical protein